MEKNSSFNPFSGCGMIALVARSCTSLRLSQVHQKARHSLAVLALTLLAVPAVGWQPPAPPAPAQDPAAEKPNTTLKPVIDPPATGVLTQKEIYRRTLAATALIIRYDSAGKYAGHATGWVLDKDRKLLMTNYHVVNKPGTFKVYFPEYQNNRPISEIGHYTKTSGTPGEAFLTDMKSDLAAMKVGEIPATAVAAVLADESTSPGETLHSVGNPGASEALWVYTTGTVRQVYHTKANRDFGLFDATIIETQSPVNPGDSGGPATDDLARLVGVVSSFNDGARLVSHFIDLSEVKRFAQKVEELFDPQTPEQFVERGEQKRALGRMDTAMRDFTSALKLRPDFAPALRLRGDCFLAQSDYLAALQDYDDAIHADSSLLMAYTGAVSCTGAEEIRRGNCRFHAGDPAGCGELFSLLPAGGSLPR